MRWRVRSGGEVADEVEVLGDGGAVGGKDVAGKRVVELPGDRDGSGGPMCDRVRRTESRQGSNAAN